MSNPIPCQVLFDLKLMVDGVTFYENKELKIVWADDGVKETQLSHLRAIGDQSYTVNQNMVDGVIKEETIDTTMSTDELENFKNEWAEKWQPSIAEKSTGIMNTFFNKLDRFFN